MMRYFTHRVLDAFARRHHTDVAYMHAMLDASPAAFRKFGRVSSLSGHRESVSVEASHAARLVGALVEDCGPCIQLVADMARGAGMGEDQIVAVLSNDLGAMNHDVSLAHAFASALVRRGEGLDELRDQVRCRWGDRGVIDLTFAAQMTRIYPMIKAGLGFAKACHPIRVGSTIVPSGLQDIE
jgi:alkylhydroperoxidase family enzyme